MRPKREDRATVKSKRRQLRLTAEQEAQLLELAVAKYAGNTSNAIRDLILKAHKRLK